VHEAHPQAVGCFGSCAAFFYETPVLPDELLLGAQNAYGANKTDFLRNHQEKKFQFLPGFSNNSSKQRS